MEYWSGLEEVAGEMAGRMMNERRSRQGGSRGLSVLSKVKANKKTKRFTRSLSLSLLE